MNNPIPPTGTTSELVQLHAHQVARAAVISTLCDGRWATMQKTPAPIAYLDVLHPFPLPVHPAIPLPGDSGGFGTAAGLEDQ